MNTFQSQQKENTSDSMSITRRGFLCCAVAGIVGCTNPDTFILEPGVPFDLQGSGLPGHFQKTTLTNLSVFGFNILDQKGWKNKEKKFKINGMNYQISLTRNSSNTYILIFSSETEKGKRFHYTFNEKNSSVTSQLRSSISQLDKDLGEIQSALQALEKQSNP